MLRSGELATSCPNRLRSRASTRGEHPPVFSFWSRRSSLGLTTLFGTLGMEFLRNEAVCTLDIGVPHSHRVGVRGQPFRLGQRDSLGSNRAQTVSGNLLHADDFQEIADTQSAPIGRRAGCRQYVIRACNVVA